MDAVEYFGIGQESSASDMGEADVLKNENDEYGDEEIVRRMNSADRRAQARKRTCRQERACLSAARESSQKSSSIKAKGATRPSPRRGGAN